MMLNKKLIFTAALWLAAATCLAGCGGGSDAPTLGQVTGVVTLDGKPLEGATVTFNPTGVRSSTGLTDAQGNFELTYIRDQKGAAIGSHKVLISKMVDEKETLPAIYNDEEKTPLFAEVSAGDNTFEFPLKMKPKVK